MKCMFNRYSCFHSAQCIKDFEGITLWPRMLGLIGHVALVAITGTTKLVPAYLVKLLPLLWWSSTCTCKFELWVPGGRFKNAYELLNLRALKFSPVNKMRIFQCMGKIFCVEIPHKISYPYIERYYLIWCSTFKSFRFKSSYAFWNAHPDPQMSCSDLMRMRGCQDSSLNNGPQAPCPIIGNCIYDILVQCIIYTIV